MHFFSFIKIVELNQHMRSVCLVQKIIENNDFFIYECGNLCFSVDSTDIRKRELWLHLRIIVWLIYYLIMCLLLRAQFPFQLFLSYKPSDINPVHFHRCLNFQIVYHVYRLLDLTLMII